MARRTNVLVVILYAFVLSTVMSSFMAVGGCLHFAQSSIFGMAHWIQVLTIISYALLSIRLLHHSRMTLEAIYTSFGLLSWAWLVSHFSCLIGIGRSLVHIPMGGVCLMSSLDRIHDADSSVVAKLHRRD